MVARLTRDAESLCSGPKFDRVLELVGTRGIDPYRAADELLGSEQ